MASINNPIDPRTLTALVAVADGGSFRAAARALGYTQSAVSHQIAMLERRLGASLFTRHGGRRGVELTAFGELAYQHAQRVLAASQALEGDIRAALAGERGTLRIGTSQSTCQLLAEPLARLRRDSPGIEVSLSNPVSAEALVQQLDQGKLDIGLYINVEPDERVVTVPLIEDAWMMMVHQNDPLAGASSVTLDALDGADIIAWHQRWRAQASLEQIWRRRRIKPRIVYRTDDGLMIQALVAAGLGSACLGAISTQRLVDPRLRRISIRDELPPRSLALCYARERAPTSAAVVLIDAVRTATRPDYGS